MVVDYLVVGLGLAGIAVCEALESRGKEFVVISDSSQRSSKVAAGLYNPVVLKRFKMAWRAAEQLRLAMPYYESLEEKLEEKLDHRIPILRKFASIEEQNNWFEASDKAQLGSFMASELVPNTNPAIEAPYGFGLVYSTGRVDTSLLQKTYAQRLKSQGRLLEGSFHFEALEFREKELAYESIQAKHLIFAEGFGMLQNPFFSYLPMQGSKGELLTLHIPALKETSIVKAGVFCIPLEEDIYRVGATYDSKDKSSLPTATAKQKLHEGLEGFLKCPYEEISHQAAVRPTVSDRRPLVGRHPKYKDLYLLNGLGSRGVLIAPYAAKQLIDSIEEGKTLDPEMDIKRFEKKYSDT